MARPLRIEYPGAFYRVTSAQGKFNGDMAGSLAGGLALVYLGSRSVPPLNRLYGNLRNRILRGPNSAAGELIVQTSLVDRSIPVEPSVIVAEPRVILPSGWELAPHHYGGGYYGTSESPNSFMRSIQLEAGNDWRPLEHVEARSDPALGGSALRGVTALPSNPQNMSGAAYWAGEGGWVYESEAFPRGIRMQLLRAKFQCQGLPVHTGAT
jgi:hypothetical protein